MKTFKRILSTVAILFGILVICSNCFELERLNGLTRVANEETTKTSTELIEVKKELKELQKELEFAHTLDTELIELQKDLGFVYEENKELKIYINTGLEQAIRSRLALRDIHNIESKQLNEKILANKSVIEKLVEIAKIDYESHQDMLRTGNRLRITNKTSKRLNKKATYLERSQELLQRSIQKSNRKFFKQ